jgi:hypothetical protein
MFNVEVTVKAIGYYFNHWPNLKIYHNNQEMFDGQIIDAVDLRFNLTCTDNNTLSIVHYGKRFGEDNIWDSDAEGKQSCYVEIKDILFNGITGQDGIVPHLEFTTHWTPKQLEGDSEFIQQNSKILSHGTMGFNGEILLEFTAPIYDWLIDKKFKLPVKETAYFSDYSSRWHYDEDIKLLEEIKSLIKYDKNRNN